MTETRISCSVCGQLGFWAYKREQSVFTMFKDAHQKIKGNDHKVIMEIK